MRCNSCEILYINGVRTHEEGCPEEWKDYQRECLWCGGKFTPKDKMQLCCDSDCAEAYYT